MDSSFYNQITRSFNKHEQKDFNAIVSIIDKKSRGDNVVIITEDPYLLLLIFTALIRYTGINIHILNPAEGMDELYRLIYTINPDCIITTNPDGEYDGLPNVVFIYGDFYVEHAPIPIQPLEFDFDVITYSPYPTKIHKISCETFYLLIQSIREDLVNNNLVSIIEDGIIPIVSNNPDYLLYYIALKSVWHKAITGEYRTLPDLEDYDFVISNRKGFLKHNVADTLFIPKKEFIELWEKEIASLFEYSFVFNSFMKRRIISNLIVRMKLKKLFKGFKNVVILGTLENAYMIEVLKNISFAKVYTMLPTKSLMFFGSIIPLSEGISPVNNVIKQERFVLSNDFNYCKDPLYNITFQLFDDENKIHSLVNTNIRFIRGRTIHDENKQNKEQYHILGNIENAFDNENAFIFPETLEKVINSYPFIRSSALLTFNNKMILLINPNQDILDSNRINQGMFSSIVQKQIDALNKELPEEYHIKGFVVSTSLIEKDRNGEIVRFPFNRCNKMEWSDPDVH